MYREMLTMMGACDAWETPKPRMLCDLQWSQHMGGIDHIDAMRLVFQFEQYSLRELSQKKWTREQVRADMCGT